MPPDDPVDLKYCRYYARYIRLLWRICTRDYDMGEPTAGQLYVLVSLMKILRLDKMLYMKRSRVLVSNGAVCIAELS